MSTRNVIDISELPAAVADHRSPIWWANVLLLIVETTMFSILIAAFFYFRQNFNVFPPPRVNDPPVMFSPLPNLDASSVNLILLLFSCVPMFWADRMCLNKNPQSKEPLVKVALLISVLFGIGIGALRFREFLDLQFKWNENAYASVIWTILGMHLLHIVTGTLENLLMFTWVMVKPLDVKHARDIRVTAIYWYWVAGVWVPLYILVFWSPRWI